MKASELIEKLKNQIDKHGDIEVTLLVEKDAFCDLEADAGSVYFESAYEPFQSDDRIFISDYKPEESK